MTEQQMQQLSRDVAAKRGIAPKRLIGYSNEFMDEEWLWLHNDSARCLELMAEHGFEIRYTKHNSIAYYYLNNCVQVQFASHNNDKPLATRIAILKALLAKEVE